MFKLLYNDNNPGNVFSNSGIELILSSIIISTLKSG